jgi:hypothetical protein
VTEVVGPTGVLVGETVLGVVVGGIGAVWFPEGRECVGVVVYERVQGHSEIVKVVGVVTVHVLLPVKKLDQELGLLL